ncbi:MAG: glutamine--fructose-6-phosphate transaminase (isomerizing) [Desulfurococcaceae archaeon]
MGGIFAIICEDIIPDGVIFEGLRRLLYRGYDGVGIAILKNNGIEVRKAPGHLNNVSKQIDLVHIGGQIAIGHTRYASRGWPVYENTHPLLDCKGNIAVVGDGIIDNYEDIKARLENLDHFFKSRTDTEVAAHLLEEYLKTHDVVTSLHKIASELTGIYSLVFLIANEKDKIYIIQHGQPLVIGLGRKCIYVSSDLPSLHGFAENAYIVEDGSVGFVSLDKIELYRIGNTIPMELGEMQLKRVKYVVEYVDKGGYPHYMLKEIYEIPDALLRSIISVMEKYLRLASMILYGAKNVFIVANGTSLHAGMVGTYYFSNLAGINTIAISAAEFPYSFLDNVATGSVIIAISQSGETSDVITSVKLAKQRGAVIIGITNNVGSRLALESNVYLPVGAGPEIAVPATKTFTSTLAVLLMLASYTGIFTGKNTLQGHREIINDIRSLVEKMKPLMPMFHDITSRIAKELCNATGLYVVSSGILYPIALESALKFKETALIHAEGLQLGELRHGPLAIVSENFPIIMIEPVEENAKGLYNKVLKEVMYRTTKLLSVNITIDTPHTFIKLPSDVNTLTYPILAITPLQFMAYNLGVILNQPIDTPPGLAKAITT